MSKYFCVFCEPDIFGNHEEVCRLFVRQKNNKVLEDYGKILEDLTELTGKERTEEIREQINELKYVAEKRRKQQPTEKK